MNEDVFAIKNVILHCHVSFNGGVLLWWFPYWEKIYQFEEHFIFPFSVVRKPSNWLVNGQVLLQGPYDRCKWTVKWAKIITVGFPAVISPY